MNPTEERHARSAASTGSTSLRGRRLLALAVELAGVLLLALGAVSLEDGRLSLRAALFGPGLCWAGTWFLLFPAPPGTTGAPPKWWFIGGIVAPAVLFLAGAIAVAWLVGG